MSLWNVQRFLLVFAFATLFDGLGPNLQIVTEARGGTVGDAGYDQDKHAAQGWGCDCCNDYCDRPYWTATADALLMHRTTAGSNPLFFDNATGGTALNAADLDFDFEAGVRLGLIWQRPCSWGLEVNYMTIDNWNSNVAVNSVGLAFTENFAGFDFFDVESFTAQYDSKFHSGEFNLRRQTGGALTWLAGFRMFELDEDMMISGSAAFGGFVDILHTDTANRLYGGQFGFDGDLICRKRIRINGVTKAGVYYNRAAQTSEDVNGTLVAPGSSLSDSKSTVSFLGEMGITGAYQLTTCLSLRAGYHLLYVSQVALAPHQTNNTNLNSGLVSTDTGGDLFAHGAVLGLELVR